MLDMGSFDEQVNVLDSYLVFNYFLECLDNSNH